MLCGFILIQEFTFRLRVRRVKKGRDEIGMEVDTKNERSDGKRSLIQEESLTSGLHDALEDDDNLKLFVRERALR